MNIYHNDYLPCVDICTYLRNIRHKPIDKKIKLTKE